MNYTEMYNKIYDSLKLDNKASEEMHYIAISIADAITELVTLSKQQNSQTVYTISEILNSMWNPLNLGGFDLDDKNRKIFIHCLLE